MLLNDNRMKWYCKRCKFEEEYDPYDDEVPDYPFTKAPVSAYAIKDPCKYLWLFKYTKFNKFDQ